MGKRGPAPTPTAILKTRNSWRAKEREAQGEMRPVVGRPPLPIFLNEEVGKAYATLVKQLEAVPGLLTLLDGPQMERYARYLVRWRNVETQLEQFSGIEAKALMHKDSRQVIKSLWSESRALDHHLSRFEDSFGLTPSARTRIRLWDKVGDAAEADAQKSKDKKRFFANKT